jgi:hypothetical protein
MSAERDLSFPPILGVMRSDWTTKESEAQPEMPEPDYLYQLDKEDWMRLVLSEEVRIKLPDGRILLLSLNVMM